MDYDLIVRFLKNYNFIENDQCREKRLTFSIPIFNSIIEIQKKLQKKALFKI